MALSKYLERIGIAGSVVSVLCCLGVSAVVSLLSALGLSFLINDAVLAPLLVAFLGLTIAGLAIGWRRHRRPWAFLAAVAVGVCLFWFSFVSPSRALAYVSIAGLVMASLLNVFYGKHPHAPRPGQHGRAEGA